MSDLDKRVEAAEERWKPEEVTKKRALLEAIKAVATLQAHHFREAEQAVAESIKLGHSQRGDYLMACSNVLLDMVEEIK